MSLRILDVQDHSIPLRSGYTFRTLSILRDERKLGWETFHLTTPKQGPGAALEEVVEGMTFYRTPSPQNTGLLAQMRLTAGRLLEIVQRVRPHVIHARSPRPSATSRPCNSTMGAANRAAAHLRSRRTGV